VAPLDADIPEAMTARTRRRIDACAIALVVVAAVLATALEAGSPIRAVVVLGAFVLVPGWALLSLGRSGPPAAMLGVAVGLSLAVDVAGGLLLVWTDLVDIAVLTAIVGTLAVLLLIDDLVRQPRSPLTAGEAPATARRAAD
jgi:hypothetical protein